MKQTLLNYCIPSYMVVQVDASVQTDNDILTDEAPQFAARPPNSSKALLLEEVDFTDVDVHVLTTPDEVSADLKFKA